jgi:ubiquinone/menaquinone biosynthesis C-methylase UbiE
MKDNNPFQNEDIAANYEAWYHTSGKGADRQEKALLKTLLLNLFPEAKTILEVGCGTGHFTHWFRTLGYTPFGLDRSRNMLNEAVSINPINCLQGDAQALPFTSQAFDVLALITTLEFIPDPQQALSEALRVARQGILLGVINKHSLLGRQYRVKGGPIWGKAALYTPAELKQMLAKVIPHDYDLTMKTTLSPIFSGASKLPWGGFIGLAVKLLRKGQSKDA